MAGYGVRFVKPTTSTSVGVASLEQSGSSTRRQALRYLCFGSSADAGAQYRLEVNRSTTAATGTALTEDPLDPADGAASAAAKEDLSAQGTNTSGAIPLAAGLNQRATFQWYAVPGSEIIIPNANSNGIHINTPAQTAAFAAAGSMQWIEL